MKKLITVAAAIAAVFTMSACKPEAKVVDNRAPDPLAEAKAKAPKAELPPPVIASVTFRCKDNSLVYVDFFQGDKMVNFRNEPGKPPVRLTAPEAGQPKTADGYSLTGTPKNITLTQPGKGEITCRA